MRFMRYLLVCVRFSLDGECGGVAVRACEADAVTEFDGFAFGVVEVPLYVGANDGYVALFSIDGNCISILAVKHALERDFKRMEEIRQQAGNEAG